MTSFLCCLLNIESFVVTEITKDIEKYMVW